MRLFLAVAVFTTFGLTILTGCQNTATPVIEAKKDSVNTNVPVVSTQPTQTDDAPRISLADAKKDFDAGNVVFVDTRAEIAYKKEHIKGSINIPMEAVEAKYKEIPTGKKIIAYCS